MARIKGLNVDLTLSAKQCRPNQIPPKKFSRIESSGFPRIHYDGKRHSHSQGRKVKPKLAMRGLSVEEPVVDQDFMEELNKVLTTPRSLHQPTLCHDATMPITALICKLHLLILFGSAKMCGYSI